jgi:uncharacterized membrane protein
MVAVALLPPLVTLRLLLGSGNWRLAEGAALLFLINITCINLAGVVTFLAQGVRPRLVGSVSRREGHPNRRRRLDHSAPAPGRPHHPGRAAGSMKGRCPCPRTRNHAPA